VIGTQLRDLRRPRPAQAGLWARSQAGLLAIVAPLVLGALLGVAPRGVAADEAILAEPGGHRPFVHFRVGSRNVKSILPRGERVWVGTSGGVIRYDLGEDRYRLYNNRNGLLANGVFHIGELDGRIAIGTYGGGLALLDEASEEFQIVNIPEGLADAFVYDSLVDADGDLWIATWSGLNRVRGGDVDRAEQWQTYTVENTAGGLPNDWVYGLAAGRDGDLWIATEGGLALLRDGEWRNWDHADGLGAPYALVESQLRATRDPAQSSSHHARQKVEMGLEGVDVAYNPNYVVALLVADDGSVWAGTWGGGLAHFDGETWHNYTVADGLPANHIFMLHQDADGSLWIGTSQGLARRLEDGFKIYTQADGLFADAVFSMATASDGSRWIGSFGGVARFPAER